MHRLLLPGSKPPTEQHEYSGVVSSCSQFDFSQEFQHTQWQRIHFCMQWLCMRCSLMISFLKLFGKDWRILSYP